MLIQDLVNPRERGSRLELRRLFVFFDPEFGDSEEAHLVTPPVPCTTMQSRHLIRIIKMDEGVVGIVVLHCYPPTAMAENIPEAGGDVDDWIVARPATTSAMRHVGDDDVKLKSGGRMKLCEYPSRDRLEWQNRRPSSRDEVPPYALRHGLPRHNSCKPQSYE